MAAAKLGLCIRRGCARILYTKLRLLSPRAEGPGTFWPAQWKFSLPKPSQNCHSDLCSAATRGGTQVRQLA